MRTQLSEERDIRIVLDINGVKDVAIDDLIVTKGINKLDFIVELSK